MKVEWFVQKNGVFDSEAALVNVNVLKAILHLSLHDVTCLLEPVNIDEVVRINLAEGKFWFKNGGDRTFIPSRLSEIDLSVPLIYGFTPYEVVASKHAAWTHDIVDGMHRLARAKLARIRFLHGVKIPAHFAILATRPKPKFAMPIYRDPKVRASVEYWDLIERNIGRCFETPFLLLPRQLQVIASEYANIGL